MIVVNAVCWKALLPIEVTLEGIMKAVNAELKKALPLMVTRPLPSAIVTVVRDLHDRKAWPPIEVTVAGTIHELEEWKGVERGLDGVWKKIRARVGHRVAEGQSKIQLHIQGQGTTCCRRY
jgi:hypothetical protein